MDFLHQKNCIYFDWDSGNRIGIILYRVPEFLSSRLNWVHPPPPPQASVSPPLGSWGGGGEGDTRTATFPIPTVMFLWAIYIFLWSVCLFCCRKIGWPYVGILIDRSRHMSVEIKLGLRPPQFLFWEYINPNFVAVQFRRLDRNSGTLYSIFPLRWKPSGDG